MVIKCFLVPSQPAFLMVRLRAKSMMTPYMLPINPRLLQGTRRGVTFTETSYLLSNFKHTHTHMCEHTNTKPQAQNIKMVLYQVLDCCDVIHCNSVFSAPVQRWMLTILKLLKSHYGPGRAASTVKSRRPCEGPGVKLKANNKPKPVFRK